MAEIDWGYDIQGTSVVYRIILPGSELGQESALARVRNKLDEMGGSFESDTRPGVLVFSAPLSGRLYATGIPIPGAVDGTVSIAQVKDTIEVVTATSLLRELLFLLVGLAIVIWLYRTDHINLGVYWLLITFVVLANAIRAWQAARRLRVIAWTATGMGDPEGGVV